MYRNLSGMSRADRWGNTGTGVTTQDAESHPEWYLRNTSGNRFTFKDYTYVWAADIGLRSLQERRLANVSAKLREADWDGVLVDDTNPTIMYHYDVGVVAKYSSDAAYSAATGSALAYIGPRLRAQGALVIPNFGTWRLYTEAVGGWLKYVSGGMEEHFTKWGSSASEGHLTGCDWDSQLKMLKQVQAMGKLFLGLALLARRRGGRPLRLGHDAAGGRRLGDVRPPRRLHARDLVSRVPLRPRRAGRQGVRQRRRHPPARVQARARVRKPHQGQRAREVRRPLPRLGARAVDRHGHAPPQRPRPRDRRRGQAERAHPARPPRRASELGPRPGRGRSGRRPCRRAITVALRATGRRVVVGRRHVAVRRTTRVRVRISAKGHAALKRGRRLRLVVRARR
jgi:hypothetical protein